MVINCKAILSTYLLINIKYLSKHHCPYVINYTRPPPPSSRIIVSRTVI